MSKEGALGDQGYSETAATVGRKLYGNSGAMEYRVSLVGPTGTFSVDVIAETGDEAAAEAHSMHNGCKVAHVEPVPQKIAA